MGSRMTIRDLLALTPNERIRFVEAIRDSIVEFPGGPKLSDAQRRELDAHFDAFRSDPDADLSWAMVKTRVIANA
jgi:putative addiction module component (TIGR02574 family)